ncbi:hypothetical protein Dip518_000735 [Parelusimicrobium proximum]
MAGCFGTTQPQKPNKGVDYGKYLDFEGKTSVSEEDIQAQEDALFGEEGDDFVGTSKFTRTSTYGDAVTTVASRKFPLGRKSGDKEVAVFRESLDMAYAAALRKYRPVGFTYSLAFVGTVNPLSDIEVQCILSEQSAQDVGQQTCALFFREAVEQYKIISAEAQNASL